MRAIRQLAPAKHNQLDLGLGSQSRSTTWSVTGFVDQADDFILRDRVPRAAGDPAERQCDDLP